MKILFVADVSIANVIGGAERVLCEQTTRLAGKGHNIHIITRRLPEHNNAYEQIDNVCEWRYSVNTKNILVFFISTVINCSKLFKSLRKKISFDLINFHQPFSSFPINLFKKGGESKKVYSHLSLSFEEFKNRNRQKRRIFHPFYSLNIMLRKKMERFNLSKCEKIIVLSQYSKNKLIRTYSIQEEKICLIPGGVDLNHFRSSQTQEENRAKLQIPRDKIVLLTIRNLVPRMGIENLINSMQIVKGEINNVFLLIGGEGILNNTLQDLIKKLNLKDSIKLCGFIKEELLPLYYQTADFFILPTVALEGFGLVTVEAMACGTPVLGTPVGGTREILNQFDPGFLFKDTNPESIAELILEKYNTYKDNPDAYERLSQKCRIFVEQNFSWENNVNRIESLFSQLVSDN